MPLEIRTPRLVLRGFASEDWQDLLQIAIDKAASPYSIYDHQFPTSEAEVKQVADRFATSTDFLAVCEPIASRVIGFIRVGGDDPAEIELGYTFHSRYWGKGYAREACTAAIDHAFSSPWVQRVVCGTAKANVPSVKLLQSLGFEETGEATGSFARDAQGKPIEFMGASYWLTRAAWLGRRRTISD